MKVVYRLTLLLLLAACLVFTLYGLLTVRREGQMFETSMIEDARLNGQTLRAALQEVARTGGASAVEHLVSEASEGKLAFRCLRPVAGVYPGLGEAAQAELARAGEFVQIERGSPGQLRLYLPLGLEGEDDALLEVRESLQREEDFLAQSLRWVGVATVVLVLLSGGLAFLIGLRVVGRPMERLKEKARRVGSGDLEGPILLTQRDEIGELARAMNEMCVQLAGEMAQRREAEGQLRHAERLATVGKLASGLAHELGTPLNVILGRALQVVEDPACPPDSIEAARIVVAQAERMSAIIRQLLDFARRSRPRAERVDLAALVSEIPTLLGGLARQRGVTIEVESAGSLAPKDSLGARPEWIVGGDPDQLRQAITNLAVNGIQAMGEGLGSRLLLALRHEQATPPGQREERACLVLRVRDEGVGIPPDELEKVFEPFFTTKDVGEGTGLGLAVTHGIVGDHGGWITVESAPQAGSTFVIHLPQKMEVPK